MLQVIAHVVSDEREHRHGIPADHAHLPRCGSRRFRSHRRSEKYSMLPAATFADERSYARPASTKKDGGKRDSLRIFPLGRDRRALAGWGGKARVRMRSSFGRGGCPLFTLPID